MAEVVPLKWVEALESGKYGLRGGFFLKNDDGTFCACGVGLDVADPTRWGRNGVLAAYDTKGGTWSEYMADLYGVNEDDFIMEVVRMHDFKNKTFPEIAAWMRETLGYPPKGAVEHGNSSCGTGSPAGRDDG